MGSPEKRISRLLVVDDDPGVLFLMIDVLRREGHQVEGADSGEKALIWLAANSADLLLLDLKLHDLSAPELVERLRAEGREIPFIVITGHGDERTAVEIMKQGALDFVMKDSSVLDFLPSIVRRALKVIERERRLFEANAAILQRERRYLRVIQTTLDGFARFSRDGRFLEVNESMCTLVGYSEVELLCMEAAEIDSPASTAELHDRIATIPNDTAARFETRLCHRDGTFVEVNVSMRQEGDEVVAFLHDISRMRRLEREVLETTEIERRRIGHDLHDGLGQQLTALEFLCHDLARKTKSEAPRLAVEAAEISKQVRQAITDTRRLSHGLTPVSLEAEGLMDALRTLASDSSRSGTVCDFDCDRPVSVHSANAAMHLYRIAQGAVTNALKHAHATSVRICLLDRNDRIELQIADNGRGLPSDKNPDSGIGLEVMNYRARLMGGRLDVVSTDGEGVRVSCSIPKSA